LVQARIEVRNPRLWRTTDYYDFFVTGASGSGKSASLPELSGVQSGCVMSAQNRTTSKAQSRENAGVLALLLLALVLFIAGIFRPFTSVTKLWLFENQISVYDGLILLWNESELFLFAVLLVFTVIFPLAKNLALMALCLESGLTRDRMEQFSCLVTQLGKWSMVDVFIVAILVITVRSGGLAAIRVEDGLFLFCSSVLLTQFAAMWIGRIAGRVE
jgi:paraquat-inducible protein A